MIRDHIKTPIETLKKQINAQITEIWGSLQKPEGFENSTLYDFFDLDYAAIPHMILDKAGFDRECNALRERFLNPECAAGWLLKPEHRRDIPADGFCTFAEKIWDVIKQNKDLDLPSQKHMLATYRCEELATEAYRRFEEEMAEVREQIEVRHGTVNQYGARVQAIITRCYEGYTQPASRYLSEVGLLKGEELSNRMHAEALRLFRVLVAIAAHSAEKDAERTLAKALADFKAINSSSSSSSSGTAEGEAPTAADGTSENAATKRYMECGRAIARAPAAALEKFDAVVGAGVLPELAAGKAAEWDATKERNKLANAVEGAALAARKEALDVVVSGIIAEETEHVAKEVRPAIDAASDGMWAQIREVMAASSARTAEKLEARAAGLGTLGDEARRTQNFIETYVSRMVIRGALHEKMKYLPLIMERRFTQLFSVDANGLPRRWNPSHNIPELFLAARDRAEDLLDLFCYMRMEPGDDCVHFFSVPAPAGSAAARNVKLSQRSLLSKPRIDRPARGKGATVGAHTVVFKPIFMLDSVANLQNYLDQFRRKAQNAYVQAVRDQEQVTYHTSIPMPYMVLLFVLGFNEFRYILSNPKLAATIAVLATTYYVLYKFNYSDRVFSFITTILFASFASIKDKFFEYMVQQIDERRAREKEENPSLQQQQQQQQGGSGSGSSSSSSSSSNGFIQPPKPYRKKRPSQQQKQQQQQQKEGEKKENEEEVAIASEENKVVINTDEGKVLRKASHKISKRSKTAPLSLGRKSSGLKQQQQLQASPPPPPPSVTVTAATGAGTDNTVKPHAN